MRKKLFKNELMHTTIIYLTALFFAMLMITGYIYGTHLLTITKESNQNFLELLKTQTEHFLQHPLTEISIISEQMDISKQSFSFDGFDANGYILRMEYIDENGIVVDTWPQAGEIAERDLSANPFLGKLNEDEIMFSDTMIDFLSNRVVMMFGKKLGAGGYLVGYMNLEKLRTAFTPFDTSGKIFVIIDHSGNYLLHPDEFAVASRSVDPNAQSIRSGEIKSGDLVKLDGETYSIEYTEIMDTGWYLLIYQNYSAILTTVYLSIGTVILLMLGAFYLVSHLFNKRFTTFEKGFSNFIMVTKKVAHGDYRAIDSHHEYEEFDELSVSFGLMINEIESREVEIQNINFEIASSRDQLRIANDELSSSVYRLTEVESKLQVQNDYLEHQKNRLEHLIEATHAGTWEWEINEDVMTINDRWAEMLGYRLSDFSKISSDYYFEFIHPDDLVATRKRGLEVFEGEVPFFDARFRMKSKNNEWVWINCIAKVIRRDPSGAPLLMSGIHLDVTKTVQNEIMIHERLVGIELIAEFTTELLKNHSKDLYDSISRLINKVCEIKGHLFWCFDMFENDINLDSMKSYNAFKSISPKTTFEDLIDKLAETYQITDEGDIKVLKGNRDNHQFDAANDQKNLDLVDEVSILVPLSDEQKYIGYFFLGVSDHHSALEPEEINFYRILANTISEAIKKDTYEKGLILSNEMANAANVAKGQFLANMSHEIRTPLNGISGHLRLIQDVENIDQIKKSAESANRLSKNMLRLVDDILNFSKIEAGKLEIIEDAFDIRENIEDVVYLYQDEAQQKGLMLTSSVSAVVPKHVVTDGTRIKQIVSNLLSNAIKFTADGEISVTVNAISMTENGGELSIEVIDTGVGVPVEQQELIFEPFNQGDNTRTRKYGGTGLGLSIVKRLVELLDGTIELKSDLGKGSRFKVTLPYIKSEEPCEPRERPTIFATDSAPYRRVLIVDDNEINQLVVRNFFELKGISCDVATNGIEAVDAVKLNDYDCVFMDVQMPMMDGYEATRIIRSLPNKSDVFIIAMTAHAMAGDREECLSAGMNEYISKPLDYDLMLDMVRRRKR